MGRSRQNVWPSKNPNSTLPCGPAATSCAAAWTPASIKDYVLVLLFIKYVSDKYAGVPYAPITIPEGASFRDMAALKGKPDIRRNLVRKGYIKGIIGMPANLFYGTGIPACVIVVDKQDAHTRKGVFMIDASAGFLRICGS